MDYFDYDARPVASARHAACSMTHRRLLRLAQARRRLFRLCRASGCFGTSRYSTSTTSPTPRVRVPRHVARLVTRLVVNYFASGTHPGASARRAARRAARRRLLLLRRAARLAAHHRLLRLRRTSECLGTSRGSSHGSSSTTLCAATSSCGHTGSTSATPCVTTTCLAATLALNQLRRAPSRRRLLVASRRPFIWTSFPNQSRTAVTPQQLVGINSD
jgi:hypothetical protein